MTIAVSRHLLCPPLGPLCLYVEYSDADGYECTSATLTPPVLPSSPCTGAHVVDGVAIDCTHVHAVELDMCGDCSRARDCRNEYGGYR
jgi:hypothetical protein